MIIIRVFVKIERREVVLLSRKKGSRPKRKKYEVYPIYIGKEMIVMSGDMGERRFFWRGVLKKISKDSLIFFPKHYITRNGILGIKSITEIENGSISLSNGKMYLFHGIVEDEKYIFRIIAPDPFSAFLHLTNKFKEDYGLELSVSPILILEKEVPSFICKKQNK